MTETFKVFGIDPRTGEPLEPVTDETSVGATAVRRCLRPVTYQNAPQYVLSPELRDGYTDIPHRVDGRLTLPPG